MKPGCFGMAIAHRNNPTCQRCPHMDECRGSALETLKAIHVDMDVSDLLKHYADIDDGDNEQVGGSEERTAARNTQRVEPAPAQESQIAAMSKKAQRLARALINKGVDTTRLMLNGTNPFWETGHRYLAITADMLMEGGFTKKDLKMTLMAKNPTWTERTAEGQLSLAFSYFNGLGLVANDRGRFVLKKES